MKIRSNYVSNSSSSSYIIGIGLIKPEFKHEIEMISNYAVHIINGKGKVETVESFNGDFVDMIIPTGRKGVTIYDQYDAATNEDGEPIEE